MNINWPISAVNNEALTHLASWYSAEHREECDLIRYDSDLYHFNYSAQFRNTSVASGN